MNTLIVELTEEVKRNLFIFLERVTLQGKEVSAYVQIIQALQKPLEKEGDK